MQIQVYLNAHEWLARKLSVHQVRYTKHDNVFLLMEDMAKAQRFADRFASLHWPTILEKYAKRVNPQMRDIFHDRSYYWVTAQNEYSTNILFKTRTDPCELYYPQLLSHSTLCFGAREAMNFLGRNLHGKFESEIVSDLSSLVCRRTGGSRIKHRVKENWLKMYDKSGLVLRVATIINNPEEFRVRKQVSREGKRQTEWVEMRKGVAYLFRYREVSLEANGRYLDALAVVDDPTQAKRDLDRVTTPKKDAAGRGCSGFNPLARHDAELFQSVMAGEHCLLGFHNRDIRARLASTVHLRACGQDPKKESAKVSRTFRRFDAHGLIAKVPRTRRWARPSPEAQAGNAPRTSEKTRSAAEGQEDKMIRVVTLDPFEEKEIQKFCHSSSWTRSKGSARSGTTRPSTSPSASSKTETFKPARLRRAATQFTEKRWRWSARIRRKTSTRVSATFRASLSTMWGISGSCTTAWIHVVRCTDPGPLRISMVEPALCTFCRAKSEHKIRMAKS